LRRGGRARSSLDQVYGKRRKGKEAVKDFKETCSWEEEEGEGLRRISIEEDKVERKRKKEKEFRSMGKIRD